MKEKEIWKEIDIFPGYFASSEGRIKKVKTLTNGEVFKRLIVPQKHLGYLRVHLHCGGSRYSCLVHRLVAHAFLGASSLAVDHINRQRDDNRACNLRYATPSENRLNSVSQPRLIIRLELDGTDFYQDFRSKRDASLALGRNVGYVGHLFERCREKLFHEGYLTYDGVRIKFIRI